MRCSAKWILRQLRNLRGASRTQVSHCVRHLWVVAAVEASLGVAEVVGVSAVVQVGRRCSICLLGRHEVVLIREEVLTFVALVQGLMGVGNISRVLPLAQKASFIRVMIRVFIAALSFHVAVEIGRGDVGVVMAFFEVLAATWFGGLSIVGLVLMVVLRWSLVLVAYFTGCCEDDVLDSLGGRQLNIAGRYLFRYRSLTFDLKFIRFYRLVIFNVQICRLLRGQQSF